MLTITYFFITVSFFYQKKIRGKKKKDKLGATVTDESVASSTLTDDDIVSNPSPVVGRRLDLPPRLWTNDPTPSPNAAARAFPHLPIQDWHKDHPDYIVPVEDRSNIVVSDFKEVSCEAELLEVRIDRARRFSLGHTLTRQLT